MITIPPSAVSNDDDAIPTPPTVDAANTEEPKKRIPLLWIAVTLSVGLLIAAIYLGGRILTAHRTGKPGAPIASIAQPPGPPQQASVQPVLPLVVPSEKRPEFNPQSPAGPEQDPVTLIAPKPGETYIQVGALDPAATRRFVDRLRNQNLDPHVAPGPKPELLRVLIGPFDSRDALNEKKAQIESKGIDTFARKY